MGLFCSCSATLKNTGTPSTQRVIKDGTKIFAMRLYGDDGVRNEITSTDTVDAAFIAAMINNADYSKRLYPIGEFRNVESLRADPVTESFNDGSSSITQKGVRTFTGALINYSNAYISQLESFSCSKFGIYTVDDCGNLTGSLSADCLSLYPIRVNESSWYPSLMKGTDTTVGKVNLAFEFHQLEQDANLRVILKSEMTSVDLLETDGLEDVTATISGEATTGFVAALTIKYDAFQTAVPVVGETVASFEAYNVTNSASITLTSSSEAPDGTYTIIMPAQTSADIIRLRFAAASATGYWMEQLITIP
jgi:hypothetical protein